MELRISERRFFTHEWEGKWQDVEESYKSGNFEVILENIVFADTRNLFTIEHLYNRKPSQTENWTFLNEYRVTLLKDRV